MYSNINTPANTVTATTTSAATAFPDTYGEERGLWIYNAGTAHVHVCTGPSTVVATGTNSIVPGGQARFFIKNQGDTHIAVLASTATQTVHFQAASTEW